MNDFINAVFIGGAGVFAWMNVMKLWTDRRVHGVDWRMWIFYIVWGFWSAYFYGDLRHWFSVIAGIVVLLGNIIWLIMYFYYRRSKKYKEAPYSLNDLRREMKD